MAIIMRKVFLLSFERQCPDVKKLQMTT